MLFGWRDLASPFSAKSAFAHLDFLEVALYIKGAISHLKNKELCSIPANYVKITDGAFKLSSAKFVVVDFPAQPLNFLGLEESIGGIAK